MEKYLVHVRAPAKLGMYEVFIITSSAPTAKPHNQSAAAPINLQEIAATWSYSSAKSYIVSY